MIERDLAPLLQRAARTAPAITLTGPRQSGKTTLCRHLFPQHSYVSLEALDERAFAIKDPRAFLARFPTGAIIDEIQQAPDLLSYLQGIIDDERVFGRWILSGSQNLALLESVSQSLAGRTTICNLLPLTRGEILGFENHPVTLEDSLFAGSYPEIFDRRLNPADRLPSYVATYVERDVRSIINVGDLVTFQRFLALCAGRTAQTLNYSSLADDCGISQPTAKAWLSALEASFIVFRLPAYHANIRKRLIKMPKLHFYDTGLVCCLLGIRSPEELRAHPLRGPIFETWVVSEIMKHRTNQGQTGGLFHYRDLNGAEVDLMVEHPPSVTLIEAKSASTASSSLFGGTKRVRRHLANTVTSCFAAVVYGGDQKQRRAAGHLIPWSDLHDHDWTNPESAVIVQSGGKPVGGAHILALFPNKTHKFAETDEDGHASLLLHTAYEPMTVFVAAEGFAAHVDRGWVPANGPLAVELIAMPDGGAVIFPREAGYVPILGGRLNPIRDDGGRGDRAYLYADNIATNGEVQRPAYFDLGEDLHLEDSNGCAAVVRIVDIIGQAALVQYRRA